MNAAEIIGAILLVLGSFTMLVGAIGVVRFPCFYTRLHAAGKGDTLGQGLILTGLFVVTAFGEEGTWNDAFKLLLIVFFVFILNATATHALARAGWLAGLLPWTRKVDAIPHQCEQYEGQMSDRDRQEVMLPVPSAPMEDEPATGGDGQEGTA